MSKLTFHFLIPGGLLALAALLTFHVVTLSPEASGFLPYLPVLVLFGGLPLGWRFNRSRLVFVLLVLALADRALRIASGPVLELVVAATAVLLPLNLAFFAKCLERGFLTKQGKMRLGLIALQPLLVGALYWRDAAGFFSAPWVDWPFLDRLPMPHFALLTFLFAASYLLLRFVEKPTAFEAAFFWVLLVTSLPLWCGLRGAALTNWFAVAGLIMTVAIIESSHGMAFRDELTGLPVRRALSEELLKVGSRYTIAMVDVDHFKKVNDTYGHDVGDQVLKMVAARLEYVSGGGRAFRYGGEEFTVLFPNRSLREVKPHLEALREAIGKASFTIRDKNRPEARPEGQPKAPVPAPVPDVQLSVTVSIGVCQRGEKHKSCEEVIKAADKALYKAKEGGRNRVCLG